MNLQFASASYESPSYFVPLSGTGSIPSKDYRGGIVHDLKNTVRKYAQHASTKARLNSTLAQLVSLGIGEPLSVNSKTTDFDTQLAVIEHFKSSPSNWSASEVEAPSEEQVRVAQKAFITMMLNSIPAPKAMLLDGGTIGAYWRRSSLYASIDFDQDGEYPWTVANGHSLRSGIWRLSQPFPQELRTAISA
jgi:hypothetical protein